MAARDQTDMLEHVCAPEAARVRARDRKRTTAMVVDNAGVRRLVLRRAARSSATRSAKSKGER